MIRWMPLATFIVVTKVGLGISAELPSFFFFNDPAPPEIYTLSLHDALPISSRHVLRPSCSRPGRWSGRDRLGAFRARAAGARRRHVLGHHLAVRVGPCRRRAPAALARNEIGRAHV